MNKWSGLKMQFGAIILLVVLGLGISFYGVNSLKINLHRLATQKIKVLSIAKDIQFQDLTLTDSVRGLIIEPGNRNELATYNEFADRIGNSIEQIKELDPQGKRVFDSVDELNDRLIELENVIISKAAGSPEEAVNIYKGEYSMLRAELQSTITDYVSGKEQEIMKDSLEAARMGTVYLIVSLIAGLISILICLLIALSIIRPVKIMANEAAKISSGDLTVKKINIRSMNELGQLAEAFNVMLSYLQNIVRQLIEKSSAINDYAQQLDSSSQQTAAAADENAATMNEIASTVELVTGNIREAFTVSESAARQAGAGKEEIARVDMQIQNIAATTKESSLVIDDLSQKSEEINQIVETITGFAEQTNLLALNAAIEAARAGDQGRGFAVVAEEVRKLAEQSAGAAKEIYHLVGAVQAGSQKAVQSIEEGNREVEVGTQVVQDIEVKFSEIIDSVQGLNVKIQEVASATDEFTAGVQNVAAATEEQTAAMEEVSALATSLSSLARELDSLANEFKVGGKDTH